METPHGDHCDKYHQACPTRCEACYSEPSDDLRSINAQIAHQEAIAPWGPTQDSYNEYDPLVLLELCQQRYELTR